MSTVAIILIVLAVLLLLFFVGGLLGARRRDERQAGTWAEHVAAADQELERARASDRGWDRSVMEAAARKAFEDEKPGFAYDELHLVLVDDKPGIEEDRAHFVATGAAGEARLVLARRGEHWVAERVD